MGTNFSLGIVFFWVVVTVCALMAFAKIIHWLSQKRTRKSEQADPFRRLSLDEVERMRATGQISGEQYEQVIEGARHARETDIEPPIRRVG